MSRISQFNPVFLSLAVNSKNARTAATRGKPKGRGGHGAGAPRERSKPKTAAELDNELDNFMAGSNGAAAPAAPAGEDVEMS